MLEKIFLAKIYNDSKEFYDFSTEISLNRKEILWIKWNSQNYNLWNTQNFQSIACRTNLYKNSFLPATTNEWNILPQNVRNAESLSCFKRQINIDRPVPNKLFQLGDRRIQIIHTELRNNYSSLNQHLFFKNIIDSPLCCFGKIESSIFFFFLECGLYNRPRQILRTAISEIAAFNLRTILFGVEHVVSLFKP